MTDTHTPTPLPSTGAASSARRGEVTVLYVAGYGRSGTTILGQVLGEARGAAYVGELNYFWADAVLGDRPCGCGLATRQCPRWSRVIDHLGPDVEDRAREVVRLMELTTRTRHGFMLLSRRGRHRLAMDIGQLGQHLGVLYRAIAAEFDADVVVDTSKSPIYRYAVESVDGLVVDTIALTRDPRAVADSWRHPKREPMGDAALERRWLIHSALMWNAFDALGELRGPHARARSRLRYEDLVATPSQRLAELACGVGHDLVGVDVTPAGEITVGPNHSVAGNPRRFDTGAVTLKADTRWQTRMSGVDHWVVTACTCARLRRNGYRLRRGHA